MAYPLFGPKIDILRKKYPIDIAKLGKALGKDKTTAWRWLERAGRLREADQRALVTAICKTLADGNWPTEEIFQENNILNFCLEMKLTAQEAAIYSGYNIPAVDLIIQSVFNGADPRPYMGHYLLFRHDKDHVQPDKPYLQACARIFSDGSRRLVYEDSWEGISNWSYEGFVHVVDRVAFIVGQRKTTELGARPVLFSFELQGRADGQGRATQLYGYVTDTTTRGRLLADRMVLARVEEDVWNAAQKSREYYVTSERVAVVATDEMLQYIDAWKDMRLD